MVRKTKKRERKKRVLGKKKRSEFGRESGRESKEGTKERFSNKLTILLVLVFVVGLILALMLMEFLNGYSNWITKVRLEKELRKFYYNSPLGITKNGKIDMDAFVRVRQMSPEEIKQKMGIDSDFCVYVVDAKDHILRDEKGNPLLLCTNRSIEEQFRARLLSQLRR